MNHHEATEQIALALRSAGAILTPVLIDGRNGASVVLTDCFDSRLSVTVEVLS